MAVCDVLGSKHLHIRNQTLSFDEVFASLKKFRDGGKDISRISVYCDQLDCTSNATGDEKDGRLAVYTVGFELTHLFIYARSFLTFSPIDSLRLADSFGLTISLYYDICNPTVVLQLCGDQRLGVCWQSDIMMVLEDQGRWRPEILQQDGEARLQATGVLGLKAYEARCQSAGREIRCRGPTTPPIVRLLRNVPPLELDAGSSPQRLSLPSPGSLPITVRMILDLAVRQTTASSRLSTSDGEIANSEIISRLRFVVTCCRKSVTHVSLVNAAKRLLRSLHPASNYTVDPKGVESTRLQVPWPGPASCLQSLNTALALVETVETENRDLLLTSHIDQALELAVRNIQNNIKDLQEVITKQFNQIQQSLETATNTVIKAIAETVPSAKDLEGLQADAKDARSKAAKSEAAMENMQAQVQTASKRLDKGIKKYQEDVEKKFIVDCVLSAIEITASVAITVATAGAGGPATAEMAAKAAKGIDDFVTTFVKLKAALKSIFELVGKMAPKLYGSISRYAGAAGDPDLWQRDSKDAVKKATELVKKSEAIMPASSVESLDYIGLLGEWEQFRIEIDDFFAETQRQLGADTVDGLSEYRVALRKLCVTGQTVLQARRLAEDREVEYQRTCVEAAVLKARQERINQSQVALKEMPVSNWVERAPERFSLFKEGDEQVRLHLAERLERTRNSALIKLYDYCVAIMYDGCLARFPSVEFHNNMSLSDMRAAQSAIGQAVTEARLGSESKGPTIVLDSDNDPANFGAGWQARLLDSRRLSFRVDLSKLSNQHFFHVRLESIKLSLEGAQARPQAASEIWYGISMGPQIADRNVEGDELRYMIEPYYRQVMLTQSGTAMEGFDSWSESNMYPMRPPVFCRGVVDFDEDQLAMLDLSRLTSCKLTFASKAMAKR